MKKFRPSEFKSIETDLIAVQNMGKINDNSLTDAPIVLFDTQKFAAFEYKEKGNSFQELPLIDTENYTERIPKDFKSIFVGGPNQLFLLCGGFDARKKRISDKAFLYEKGRIIEILEMYDARQFFGICSSLTTESNKASTATNESFNQISKEYFDQQMWANSNQNF